MAKAKEYILQHLADSITTACVADHVCRSRSHVCRLFKRETGLTVRLFARRARMEQAKMLLHDRGMLVKEVARATGFLSIPSFCRQFTEQEGLTPLQYQSTPG